MQDSTINAKTRTTKKSSASVAKTPKSVYNSRRANSQYKDRLFCAIFGDPSNKASTLSLYNALNGTNYDDPDDLEVVTLDDAIYATMKNDVAVLLDYHLTLVEHQSTVNPNMPLRGLMYFAHEYERLYWQGNSVIYSSKRIKIAAPKYFVLYNGTKELPAISEMRLSEAFAEPSPGYEWTAYVYNINAGQNTDVMDACKDLSDYSILVAKIRTYEKEGYDMSSAVTMAVDDCIKEGILSDFLTKHRERAISSLISEYDEAGHHELLREEGFEEGVKEGVEKGVAMGEKRVTIRLYLSDKISADIAAAELGITTDDFLKEVEKLQKLK